MGEYGQSTSTILQPVGLCWIKQVADDPGDLCAHGHVDFRIGEEVLVHPLDRPEVTVSAAALYLLRSLEKSHSREAPVGDQLFPCCGFSMFEEAGSPDVVIIGCPNGLDFEVLHGSNVQLKARTGRSWHIPMIEWRAAVFAFADRVSEFYASCSAKCPTAGDSAGFRRFVAEWERRRGAKFGANR